MTLPEISAAILALKEERATLYPELGALKAEIKKHGDQRQTAPDHLVNQRDETQAAISDLTLRLDRLQHQRLQTNAAETETRDYQNAIRRIVCALVSNPSAKSFFHEDVIPEAIEIEAAIRELSAE